MGSIQAHPALSASLQTEGGLLAAAGGWEGVSGESICFLDGYYATEGLVKQYGVIPVEMATLQDAVQGVKDGNCVAVAEDTGRPERCG